MSRRNRFASPWQTKRFDGTPARCRALTGGALGGVHGQGWAGRDNAVYRTAGVYDSARDVPGPVKMIDPATYTP